MRSHPDRSSRSADTGSARPYACSLAGRDWELLVRLPAHVLAAALATPPGCELAVDRALAGLAAIAAARTRGGPLVREVVAAIFANDDPAAHAVDAAVSPAEVHAECVAAGRVLAQRIPAGEADGYRRWLRHVGAAAGGVEPLLASYDRALAG
jgi:hypothetical protein